MRMGVLVLAVLGFARIAFGEDGSTGAVDPAVQLGSAWDFVVKGGPVMIPIGLCSFVAMTIVIERLVSLRRTQVIPPRFRAELNERLNDTSEGYGKALDYCVEDGSPIAQVFAAGLKRVGQPLETIEKYIVQAGEGVVFNLRKNLRALAVIASITPLLGLLGTIFGMIAAFQTVATSGEALGRTEVLAKGIYQAMITTAAGLMVAIPVLIAYHFFTTKIDRLVRDLDVMTVDFVETHGTGGAAAAPRVPKLQAVDDVPAQVAPAAVSA